ncbi:MAG: helix-turn-helix transcriptional regulator [Clostridia bacterium]|nr:helix-turn-helix transcriptional regulator [Clostridia bacterium]
MIYMDLGKKIKEERIEKGYTQEELGEKIDSTGAYIGQIERGERNASMAKIVLIAEALNISIDYLTGNFVFEQSEHIDGKLADELKDATNKQKEMMMDIIKIIKKYK